MDHISSSVCGFYVYSILVNCMFQVYVYVLFLYKSYVFVSRPCFKSMAMFKLWACFYIKGMSMYQVHVSIQGHVLVQGFLFILRSILCFYGFMFLFFYVSLFPSIQKPFIQKLHRLFVGVYVSCIIF